MKINSKTKEKVSNLLVASGMIMLVGGIGLGDYIGIWLSLIAAIFCTAAIFTDMDTVADCDQIDRHEIGISGRPH